MCYKNHQKSGILKAVSLDSNQAHFSPSCSKLLNISGLQIPHLQNEDDNKDDKNESEMMMMAVAAVVVIGRRKRRRRGGGIRGQKGR